MLCLLAYCHYISLHYHLSGNISTLEISLHTPKLDLFFSRCELSTVDLKRLLTLRHCNAIC